MAKIIDAPKLSNAFMLYSIGCLYQGLLKQRALQFLIKNADSVLSASSQMGIGCLRGCDLREFLCCEDLRVPEERLVYSFIKCWKDGCGLATSDKSLQALFASCVRWASMPIEQIRANAAEEIVDMRILWPHLLKPQTESTRAL